MKDFIINNKHIVITLALLAIIFFALMFGLFQCAHERQSNKNFNYNPLDTLGKSEKIDTIFCVKPSKQVNITKRAKVEKRDYSSDSTIIKNIDSAIIDVSIKALPKPYTAVLDTIIYSDTIKAIYQYPENIFSISIKEKADTAYNYRKTITIYVPVEKKIEEAWYIKPAYMLGGLLGGYLLGNIGK